MCNNTIILCVWVGCFLPRKLLAIRSAVITTIGLRRRIILAEFFSAIFHLDRSTRNGRRTTGSVEEKLRDRVGFAATLDSR